MGRIPTHGFPTEGGCVRGNLRFPGMGSQYYFIISFYEIQKYNPFESSKGYNYSIQGTYGSLGRTLPFYFYKTKL